MWKKRNVHWWMNGERKWSICIQWIPFSLKQEGNPAICHHMDKPGENMPDIEGKHYMRPLRWAILNSQTQKQRMWLPGAGGGEHREVLVRGYKVSATWCEWVLPAYCTPDLVPTVHYTRLYTLKFAKRVELTLNVLIIEKVTVISKEGRRRHLEVVGTNMFMT